jgi:hypothetical protein
MMPGLMELTRAPRSPHSTLAACTRSVLARLEIAYAVPELVMTSGWREGSWSSSPAGVRASASFCSGGSGGSQRLLTAAGELFAQRGLGVTLNDIAPPRRRGRRHRLPPFR